jgi:O-antigen/teichoic acid export membrane protein
VSAKGGTLEDYLSGSSLRRRLLSGSAWASGGRIGGAMVGIVTNALLARMLTPQEFGAYFLAFSIVSFGAVVGALGLPKTVVWLVAENMGLKRSRRTRRVIYTVFGIGVFGTLGVSLAYLLVGDPVSKSVFQPQYSSLLVGVTGLMAGWIAISVVQEITAETFRGFHDIRWATLLGGLATGGKSGGLVMRILLLGILALIWVKSETTDLQTVMLVSIGSGSVSVLLSGWLLWGKVSSLGSKVAQGEEEPGTTKEVLDDAIPFLVIALTTFVLLSSDIWILGALGSGSDTSRSTAPPPSWSPSWGCRC